MSFISKDDKKTWENYITNLYNVGINFQNNQKSLTLRAKKVKSKKTLSQSYLKQIKQGKLEPEGVIDLHGHRLHTAKITLQKYILNAFYENTKMENSLRACEQGSSIAKGLIDSKDRKQATDRVKWLSIE